MTSLYYRAARSPPACIASNQQNAVPLLAHSRFLTTRSSVRTGDRALLPACIALNQQNAAPLLAHSRFITTRSSVRTGDRALQDWGMLEEFKLEMSDDDVHVRWKTFGWPKKIQEAEAVAIEQMVEVCEIFFHLFQTWFLY